VKYPAKVDALQFQRSILRKRHAICVAVGCGSGVRKLRMLASVLKLADYREW
jgi:hypothetical protein